MTEFGYNEPNKGSLKNIPLNMLILFGLFLILTFGVIAIAWEWLKGELATLLHRIFLLGDTRLDL